MAAILGFEPRDGGPEFRAQNDGFLSLWRILCRTSEINHPFVIQILNMRKVRNDSSLVRRVIRQLLII